MTQTILTPVLSSVVLSAPLASEPALSPIVVVANRLPVHLPTRDGDDDWQPSPGGLVSALTALLQNRGGQWIGWSGAIDRSDVPEAYEGIRLTPIEISDCLLYTSPSPRDRQKSRMPSSA